MALFGQDAMVTNWQAAEIAHFEQLATYAARLGYPAPATRGMPNSYAA